MIVQTMVTLKQLRSSFFAGTIITSVVLISNVLYTHVQHVPVEILNVMRTYTVHTQSTVQYGHVPYLVKKTGNIDCFALFNNDTNEMQSSKNSSKEEHTTLSAEHYINMTFNCSMFISERGYITSSLTKDEQEFPIGFSILMHKDPGQVERLLRAIYRPEHTYCIHLDNKSSPQVYQAMSGIASCFDNVFLASKRINVRWGKYSLLQADLTCINDLWESNRKWKYMLTLTGQEFPLRTNYELVQILKTLRGTNIALKTLQRHDYKRWQRADPPPHNITPAKGSFHVGFSRGAVDFMLHDQRSLDLLNWTRFTGIPDETYYVTLNYNGHLGMPGSYTGNITKRHGTVKPFLARYKHRRYAYCHGLMRHGLCIFGSGDLPILAARKELFVNKLYWNYQHTLDCMEELIFNRTRDQYLGKMSFDPTWYKMYANNKDNVK